MTITNGIIQGTEGLREVKNSMKFRVVLMTPTVAQALLDKNHPRNRTPKPGRISMYANDIINDRWQLTHEAVAINEDGYLIDGQNRLAAIIQAGKAAPILLITGVPCNAMLAVDQGLSRTVADIAKVYDESKPSMTAWVGVARAMIYGTKVNLTEDKGKRRRASAQEVLEFIRAHEQAIAFAMEVTHPNTRFVTQAGVRAVIARAFYGPKHTHDRIREFANVLTTGLMGNTKKDSAAIRLRNWLTDSFSKGTRKRSGGKKPSGMMVYAKTQTALKAFLEERNLEFLRETNEENFPLPEEQ